MKWARHVATLLVLLVGGVGCERKAPGPAECEAVALRLARLSARGPTGRMPQGGPIVVYEDDVREVAIQCLTTPFDRELVRCVVELKRDPRICAAAFRDRQRRKQEQAEW